MPIPTETQTLQIAKRLSVKTRPAGTKKFRLLPVYSAAWTELDQQAYIRIHIIAADDLPPVHIGDWCPETIIRCFNTGAPLLV